MLLRILPARAKWLDRSTMWAEIRTVKVKDAEYSPDSRMMLVIGLKQEQLIIKRYRERISQKERSGEFALSEALKGLSHRNKTTK